ncbi:MAG: hypothetical protein L0H53_14975 [Candidatus Nitrosocosmicus sp.]|nr:hypothetical protein [Candidatus Nitrosocosmicus sp.]MDN5868509.1 hypothetical protein [Candidatus Nitrosocosmicus sp.]
MESKLTDLEEFIKKKLLARLGNSRRVTAINSLIAGIVLSFVYFGGKIEFMNLEITIDSNSYLGNSLMMYGFFTLIFMSVYLIKKPYITPEIKNIRCHYCDSLMSTKELRCQNCPSSSHSNSSEK